MLVWMTVKMKIHQRQWLIKSQINQKLSYKILIALMIFRLFQDIPVNIDSNIEYESDVSIEYEV